MKKKSAVSMVAIGLLSVSLLTGCQQGQTQDAKTPVPAIQEESDDKKIARILHDNLILDILSIEKSEFGDDLVLTATVENKTDFKVLDATYKLKHKKSNEVFLVYMSEGLNPGEISGNIKEYLLELDEAEAEDFELVSLDTSIMYKGEEILFDLDYATETFKSYSFD